MLTEVGEVELDVPRDRDGSFEPQIVMKRQRVSPRCTSRCSIAIASALLVKAAVGLWLIDQPTTRRLNASRTTAE